MSGKITRLQKSSTYHRLPWTPLRCSSQDSSRKLLRWKTRSRLLSSELEVTAGRLCILGEHFSRHKSQVGLTKRCNFGGTQSASSNREIELSAERKEESRGCTSPEENGHFFGGRLVGCRLETVQRHLRVSSVPGFAWICSHLPRRYLTTRTRLSLFPS